METGDQMHAWATELFPLCRSLTGDGTRDTLRYLKDLLPALELHEVPSGTPALDWIVPDEWNIRDAYIEDQVGHRVVDFAVSNLHVMGYSEPVDAVLSRAELEDHLHSLPGQPDAIPYVTSAYRRTWGFCVSQRQRDALGNGPFRVVIDSTLGPGSLTYADLVIPGESEDEVLLSTYVCHPSMANNELSGPVVATALGRWISSLPRRRYTYRLVFVPETIGPIVYLSRHLKHLRERVRAGWVLTCVGDDRAFSFVPSRLGGTLADRISLRVLRRLAPDHVVFSFLDRGSDERQWCSPGADLPVCSVMRSKYGTYPEYHTSLDDLNLITASGLQASFDVIRTCLQELETRERWQVVFPGEPQLGRRDLYPRVDADSRADTVPMILQILAYCDGEHDLDDLADRIGRTPDEILPSITQLVAADVIRSSLGWSERT